MNRSHIINIQKTLIKEASTNQMSAARLMNEFYANISYFTGSPFDPIFFIGECRS
jgi:hypothetical protein